MTDIRAALRALSPRVVSAIAGLAGIALIVLAWWIIAVTVFTTPSGEPGPVPTPGDVVAGLIRALGNPVYLNAIVQTTGAAALGYVYGVVFSLALASLVALVPLIESVAMQLAVVAACVPITALGPIVAIMSMPGSRTTSVVLAALSTVFTTVVGAVVGFHAASSAQLDVVAVYGGSRWDQFARVRVIAAVPRILASLKIAAPAAFLGAVVGEYFLIGVDSGIGVLLLAAQRSADSVRLWTTAILCTIIAGGAYALIAWVERRVAPWASVASRSVMTW
jgi:ABC-type nitrate/sulfonate/bicarbonate transport system permease component